jgi:hypothetical protein
MVSLFERLRVYTAQYRQDIRRNIEVHGRASVFATAAIKGFVGGVFGVISAAVLAILVPPAVTLYLHLICGGGGFLSAFLYGLREP